MALTYSYELVSVLSAVLLIYASAILHIRMRTGATLSLLLSILLLGFYYAAYPILFAYLIRSNLGHMEWIGWSRHAVVPATLELLVAVSFLFFVRSALRPNSSFKPKPLRGSA